MTCRHPRTAIKTTTHPFAGCVTPEKCNEIAHGNVREKETCTKCGATRYANINGMAVEQGTWIRPQS